MMMKMLEAADIPILIDEVREADRDNPEGYYEDERAKKLHKDNTWVREAEDKAVKVISYHLTHLPSEHEYRVIFMKRHIEEVLASQRKMMERRGESQNGIPDNEMAKLFHKHLEDIKKWLERQPNMETIYVSYNETLVDPRDTAEKVEELLDRDLDVEKMIQVVEPGLYRQRK
jgi:broad-specificity NMP kinase